MARKTVSNIGGVDEIKSLVRGKQKRKKLNTSTNEAPRKPNKMMTPQRKGGY